MIAYRKDLPALPPKMHHLPLDHRGFPIPWFVAVIPHTGERDFRVADADKKVSAIRKKLCWVCGSPLGQFKAFVIGPMCVVNRTTSEPPCHLECAHYSAIACPFLTRPRMRRNDQGLEDIGAVNPPGEAIMRNPGATCVWVCKEFKIFRTSKTDPNAWLIRLTGEPTDVFWYAHSRTATRVEVLDSIDSGMPLLEEMARKDGADALVQLHKQRQAIERHLPAAA